MQDQQTVKRRKNGDAKNRVCRRRRVTSRSPQAEIQLEGQSLLVCLPPGQGELLNALWTVRFGAVDDAVHGCRTGCVRRSMVKLLDASQVVGPKREPDRPWECWACNAGLFPVVLRLLKDAGYRVRWQRRLAARLITPASIRPSNLPVDEQFLSTVQQHPRAMFRCGGGVRTDWLVAQTAQAWPSRSLFIWTNSVEEARSLKQQLRRRKLTARWTWNGSERLHDVPIVVGQQDYATLCKRNVLIFTDAAYVARKHGLRPVEETGDARVYGLLRAGESHAPFAGDLMRSVFGFTTVDIPRHGCHVIRPDVVTVRYRGGVPASADQDSAYEVRRAAIWLNNGRNRFLATLVRAFKHRSCSKLRSADEHLRNLITSSREDCSVVVLAENLEHAVSLGKLLPEAALLQETDLQVGGLSRRDGEWVERAVQRQSRICIAMWASRERADTDSMDVWIRADAGPEAWCPLRIVSSNAKSPLVVDVLDDSHWLLRDWQRQRRQEYPLLGQTLNGVATPDDVQRFLDERIAMGGGE